MNNRLRALVGALFIAMSVMFVSCDNEPLLVDNVFAGSDTYAEYTDQTSIELATVKIDSVLTSNRSSMWVGKNKLPVIGEVCSNSYFKPGIIYTTESSNYFNWSQKEEYDSICVYLTHTGSYVGDTLKGFTVNFRRTGELMQHRKLSHPYLYNNSVFKDSTSIGSFRYRPRPHKMPSIRYRLDDAFGRELVSFIKKYPETGDQTKDAYRKKIFENMLGGIKLEFGEDAKCLLEYNAGEMKIVLHTHITDISKIKKERYIKMESVDLQYNSIWNEDITEPYGTLTTRLDQVSENVGGNHSVLFEGLGYYTRINIIGMKDILSKCYGSHPVKANLVLYAERGSYNKYSYPNTIQLRTVTKGNVVEDYVRDSRGQVSTGYLRTSYPYNENLVFYKIDITNYINRVAEKGVVDENEGLIVTWNGQMDPSNFNFMAFNGRSKEKYYSYLEIYYYDYDRE